MRFGVPDAKLEKWMIDRRVDVLAAEGIHFEYGADIGGADMSVDELRDRFNAVVVATGSRVSRKLEVPGSDLAGVHDAMDYLYIRNRYVASISGGPEGPEPEVPIVAEGKDVVVIGGGDTGMDCISNANREGARSALLLDVYPEVPKDGRYPDTPWPLPLKRSATTYALDEGGERRFGHQVIELRGDSDGNVAELVGRKVTGSSSRTLEPVEGSEYTLPAQLVLIAVGFTGPEREGLLDGLGVELDARGNVHAPAYAVDRERNLRRRRRPSRPVPDRHRNRRGPPLRPSSRPLPEGRGPGHGGRPPDHPAPRQPSGQPQIGVRWPRLSSVPAPEKGPYFQGFCGKSEIGLQQSRTFCMVSSPSAPPLPRRTVIQRDLAAVGSR